MCPSLKMSNFLRFFLKKFQSQREKSKKRNETFSVTSEIFLFFLGKPKGKPVFGHL
jgi:hypothetical protein